MPTINLELADGRTVTLSESGWQSDDYPAVAAALTTLYPVNRKTANLPTLAQSVATRFRWRVTGGSAPKPAFIGNQAGV